MPAGGLKIKHWKIVFETVWFQIINLLHIECDRLFLNEYGFLSHNDFVN